MRSLIKLAAVFIQDTQVPGSVGFPGWSCRKKKRSVVKSSRRESRAVLGVVLLANSEGHIAVLDHVLDLFSHGKNEEDNPVHDQHGPEDGHIKDLEPTAHKRDEDGSGGPVPELELGESSNEGLELLILLGGESAHGAILHLIVDLFVRGVKLGLQEGQEQVQQVDAERIGNDVPALREQDSKEEEEEADNGADPSVEDKGGRLVQQSLVMARNLGCVDADSLERGLLRLWRIHLEQVSIRVASCR